MKIITSMKTPKSTRPELLLPAGDMEKLKFAFQYGADAVYAGVPMFSLRARENKFNIESVKEAVDYTRKLGKKIYLTLNIYPRNYKIPALIKALKPLADLKPDAFIIADPGIIMLCKEIVPQIPIHLSVQANNVNWASAKFWHQQGVSRIILSREISLNEIKEIHEKNPTLELEFFVHGSICVAYSGRCLLSNYLTYRDANQGTCVQACRWGYNVYVEGKDAPGKLLKMNEDEHGTYLMNSKDMCLIEYLKELKDAGICSFKVEGRNKTFYYAATVAKTYRQAIDDMSAKKPFNPELIKELAKTSNRGFIPGFIIGNPQEKAQEYEKSYTHQTHDFIGVVREIHKKGSKTFYEIEVKGRLDAPTSCEILTPNNEFTAKIKEFHKPNGEITQTIHPGQKDHVLIELPRKVEIGAILRKEKMAKTTD
jgi:putative protease